MHKAIKTANSRNLDLSRALCRVLVVLMFGQRSHIHRQILVVISQAERRSGQQAGHREVVYISFCSGNTVG
jgi:hypothetical protein